MSKVRMRVAVSTLLAGALMLAGSAFYPVLSTRTESHGPNHPIVQYDALSRRVVSGSYGDAISMSMTNPAGWAQMQRDYSQLGELAKTYEIREVLAQRDISREKTQAVFPYILLGAFLLTGGVAAFVSIPNDGTK